MKNKLSSLCVELTKDIQDSYEKGTSLDEAEKLAAKFLHAQILIAEELKTVALEARMRKSGVKAVRSAVRTEELKKHDKKPTEGALEDVVNLSELVGTQQDAYDTVDTDREYLENYLSIFKDAHIYFRSLSRGRFE